MKFQRNNLFTFLGTLLLPSLFFNIAHAEHNDVFAQVKKCGGAIYSYGGYGFVGHGDSLQIAAPDAEHSLHSLNTMGSIQDFAVTNDLLYVLTNKGIEERNVLTGELLNQFDLPATLRSERVTLKGMKVFEGKFYIAAGRSGILVFDSLNKTFEGQLELPNLNPSSNHQSAYVDVAVFDHHLIFLVDDYTLNQDPRGPRAFSGFVVYDPQNRSAKVHGSITDPGFETINIVHDKILITSFLPAWTFSANALTENQQARNLKKLVSLGNLGRMKRGKIFVDDEKDMIYACLAEKSTGPSSGRMNSFAIVPISSGSID